MSKELVCPFCNKKLEPIGTSGQFQCGTWGCDASFNFIATRDVWEYIDRTRKALDYCIERFKSLENVLDEKAEASDIPDNPDLYAWAVRIKTIWSELKEITETDYKAEHK